MKEILTPREAADYLSIHVRTIYRLAKNREIPCRKVGGSWRFKKDALDEWLTWKENPSIDVEPTAKALASTASGGGTHRSRTLLR